MRLLLPSLSVLCLFLLGGAIFKTITPTHCETILSGDSVFVLTGDARRIPFAMRKIQKFPHARLYIIGAGGVGGGLSTKVVVESDSKSTYQNALAIKQIVKEHNLKRIVIVTTVDHFNRAKYLIRREMPNVEIVACPVGLTGMGASKRLERWTTEYIKYIGTLAGMKES